MSDSDHEIEKPEIGQALRAAREAAGADIDEVAAILRIRSDHLQALEDDDFDRLPGSVYAIGFIRTYATHLGINGAELITRYKAIGTMPHLDEPSYDPQAEVEPTSNAIKIAAVLVGVFLVYLTWLIAGGARDDEPRVAEIDTAVQDVTSSAPSAPKNQAQVAPKSRPAEAPRQAAPQAGAEEPPSAGAQTDVVTGRLPIADPLASAPKVEVAAIADVVEPDPAQIEIRANRHTWMRIENTEGRVLFSSIIRDSESFELTEPQAYTLATRDAGALEFVVDGEIVGAVGRRGQILTARQIDRNAILALKP